MVSNQDTSLDDPAPELFLISLLSFPATDMLSGHDLHAGRARAREEAPAARRLRGPRRHLDPARRVGETDDPRQTGEL